MYTNEDIARVLFYHQKFDFHVCYWYSPGLMPEGLTVEEAERLSTSTNFREVSEDRLQDQLDAVEAKVRKYNNFRDLLEMDIPALFGIYPPRECINRAILELENDRDREDVIVSISREIVYDYPSKPGWIDTLAEVPVLLKAYKSSVVEALKRKVLPVTHRREVDQMMLDLDIIEQLTPHQDLVWFFERLASIRQRMSEIFFFSIRANLEKLERRMRILLSTYFCPTGELFGQYREFYKPVYPEVRLSREREDKEMSKLLSYEVSRRIVKCLCGRRDRMEIDFKTPIGTVAFCTFKLSTSAIKMKIGHWLYCHFAYDPEFDIVVTTEDVDARHDEWCKYHNNLTAYEKIPIILSDYYMTLLGQRGKGNHAQIDPFVYNRLYAHGYDLEGFAAPYNRTFSKWYSLNPLDRFLGSRGSFFKEENDGHFLLNPPYEHFIIREMLKMLRPSSKYIIFLPDKEDVVNHIKELQPTLEYVTIPHAKIKMRQFWDKGGNFGDGKMFEPINDILIVFSGQDQEEKEKLIKVILNER